VTFLIFSVVWKIGENMVHFYPTLFADKDLLNVNNYVFLMQILPIQLIFSLLVLFLMLLADFSQVSLNIAS